MKTSVISFLSRFSNAKSFISKYPNAIFFALALITLTYIFTKTDVDFTSILYHKKIGFSSIISHGLCHVFDALILLIPFVLLPQRFKWLEWIVIVLAGVWCFIQELYFPYYFDLMPFSSFVLVQNIDSTLIDSAKSAFRWRHLMIPIAITLLFIAYFVLRKFADKKSTQPFRRSLINAAIVLLVAVCAKFYTDVSIYNNDDDYNRKMTFAEYMAKHYTVIQVTDYHYYSTHGFITYAFSCMARTIKQCIPITSAEKRQVESFLSRQPRYTDNTYSAGKDNLILIIVESLNSWVVNLTLDGKEITPTLNALFNDSTTIATSNMIAQAKNGRSSDGQFMYNTGLLPLMSQPVAMSYAYDDYPALAKALPHHVSTVVCCDKPKYWNIGEMMECYGYKTFHGNDEIQDTLSSNGYYIDKALFENATRVINNLKSPFIAEVITMGMHCGYDNLAFKPTWISQSDKYTPQVRNYLEKCAEFDAQLKLFLERLKQSGKYDNSLIVIASDHHEFVDHSPQGRPSIDPEGNRCVMMIIGAKQSMKIDGPIGQVDIYPTILDLMGANHYQWKGLGNSLLRTPVHSVATSPTEAKGQSPLVQRQKQAWDISRIMVTKHWFKSK
jgi:phosphoglycerol transferase MdoB-like AlkP superfamily enzyme